MPGDESGSVLLLSGMMSFLVAFMALYAVDTSQVIYNRITAQNAADAAAETAALWQARGLNLVQELNDFHYFFNESIFVAEAENIAQCATIPLGAGEAPLGACTVGDIFTGLGACEAACSTLQNDCHACEKALDDNNNQKSVAASILNLQSNLCTGFALMTLEFASDAAQVSGADPIISVLPEYVGGAISTVFSSGGLSSIGSALTGVGESLSSLTSQLPPGFQLYAMPINKNGTSLNLAVMPGKCWPWMWCFLSPDDIEPTVAKGVLVVMWTAAYAGCSGGMVPCLEVGDSPILLPRGGFEPSSWTWSDSYFIGHPGYMTWVAGKTNEPELAGLGYIRWLNPSPSPPAAVNYWMNQTNLSMYTGPVTDSSGTPVQIPAVIGLASSQVEGTGVIAVDKTLIQEAITDISSFKNFGSLLSDVETALGMVPLDSTPRLISVYLPPNGTAGTNCFIYH